jgi:hypothetical protein
MGAKGRFALLLMVLLISASLIIQYGNDSSSSLMYAGAGNVDRLVRGKVLITGTGRAGTTFLIRLMTSLDLDTGLDRMDPSKHIDENCGSGMENPFTAPHGYLKNPTFMPDIENILSRETIAAVVIPVRNYTQSALSRARLGIGKNGGLWGATDAQSQETFYHKIMAEYIVSMVKHDIPTVFADFDRMVVDPDYLYTKLQPVLPPKVSLETFKQAFGDISRHRWGGSYSSLG